jgi:hypothetical protein
MGTDNLEHSFGCDNCKHLKAGQCTLWDVSVGDPAQSYCYSGQPTA